MQTIRGCGANLVASMTFPDHHNYSAHDIQSLEKQARECEPICDAIICTGKDLSKIDTPRIGQFEVWSLDVELKIRTGAEILNEYLERVVAGISTE